MEKKTDKMASPEHQMLYRAIGEVVMCQRNTLGLTMEQLSERIHVHKNTIYRVECGKTRVSFTLLVIMAEGLGIKLSTVFRLAEHKIEKWRREEGIK